jgi:hypothetical protein
MKWPQIIVVLVGIISVAIAVRFRPEKPTAAPKPVREIPPAVVTGGILPPSVEQPGVASRLVGLLRTYVAVADEIRLEPSVDAPAARVVSIPILIVFENETYRPLTAEAIGWLGKSLCTVRVARLPEAGGEIEVFQTEVPLPARADWLSAERRSIAVDWPLRESAGESATGDYKVSVRLTLPDEPAIEIYTRLL